MSVQATSVRLILCLIAPWAWYFFSRYFGPLRYDAVPFLIYVHIGIFIFFYSFGVVFGQKSGSKKMIKSPDSQDIGFYGINSYRSLWWILATLSVIFLFIAILDAISGNVFSSGITAIRYEGIQSGPRNSLSGAVKYMLAGAPPILACLLMTPQKNKVSKTILVMSVFLVIASFAAFFLQGGRNTFIISAIVVLTYATITGRALSYRKRMIKKNGATRFWFGLAIIIGVTFSLYLFVERAAIRGVSVQGSFRSLSIYYGATERWSNGLILSIWGELYGILVMLHFYVTHSLSYYAEYIQSDYSPYTLGAYSFNFIARLLDYIFGFELLASFRADILTPGVYLSLPGTVYVDFGLLGVAFFGLLLGYVCSTLGGTSRSKHKFEDFALLSVFITTAIISPVYAVFNIGNGLSLFIMLYSMKFLGKIRLG